MTEMISASSSIGFIFCSISRIIIVISTSSERLDQSFHNKYSQTQCKTIMYFLIPNNGQSQIEDTRLVPIIILALDDVHIFLFNVFLIKLGN